MPSRVTAGILRPTIGVPEDFDREYDSAQQEAMLLHELGHLAGRDPAWHAFADLVTIALWWHPMAWWARHELRVADEFAADETSAVVEGGPDALAASLVKVGARLDRARAFSSRLGGLAHVEGSGFRSGLGRRVERLLSLSRDPSRPCDRHSNRFSDRFSNGFSNWFSNGFSRVAILAVLVAALISSTLWLRPLTVEADLASYRENTRQGESTMTTTLLPIWKRSLAGLTILAVLGAGAAQDGDDLQDLDATPVVDLSEDPALPEEPDPPEGSGGVEDPRVSDEPNQARSSTLDAETNELKQALRLQALALQTRKARVVQQEQPLQLQQLQEIQRDRALRDARKLLNDARDKAQSKDRVRTLEDQVKQLRDELRRLSEQLVERKAWWPVAAGDFDGDGILDGFCVK